MLLLSETTIPDASAFDELAGTYDATFTDSAVGTAQRRSVWTEIDRTFQPGQRILEINCGTGVDALHLAQQGVEVVACDSAPAMIAVAQQRLGQTKSRAPVDFRVLATEQIGELRNEGPFDGVLSNFAGLNCIQDLGPVARELARLVKPEGIAILCLFGRFCLWETAWYLTRGDLRKATRRLDRKCVEGALTSHSGVKVWYPPVRQVRKVFSPNFHLRRMKGVGVVVPPSYLEPLVIKHPRLFRAASHLDHWLGRCAGLRAVGDHMLLTFERIGS
jgi:ubiquinone/menaquinone biosynthesis C-methylase UbiE